MSKLVYPSPDDTLFAEQDNVCEDCEYSAGRPQYIDADPGRSHPAESWCSAKFGNIESIHLELYCDAGTYYYCRERIPK